MENLFVVFWVIMATQTGTKASFVQDTMYTEQKECEQAAIKFSTNAKTYEGLCFKVMLPLSTFRQIKDVGVAK